MDDQPSQAGTQPLDGAPEAEQRTTEQVRDEIEQTRAELGDTVAALAEKTDMKAQAKRAVHNATEAVSDATPDSAGDAARRGSELLRANPALMVGVAAVAAGWLLGRRSGR